MLTKIVTISVGILVAQLVCVTADEPDHTRSVLLTPFPDHEATEPKQRQHDSWEFSLEPKEMARYNVTIAERETSPDDKTYIFQSSSYAVSPPDNINTIWTWTVNGGDRNYVCNVANTHWLEAETAVTISCTWTREAGDGNGEGAGDPDIIEGSAKGIASAQEAGFVAGSDLEIEGAPDYLCIHDTVELHAWLVIGEFPYDDSQPVDADWTVEPVSTNGGAGTFNITNGSSVVFTPTETGEVKVTASVPEGSGTLEDSVTFTIFKVEIEQPGGLPVQTVEEGDEYFRDAFPWCFEWQYVHVDNEVVPYYASQLLNGMVKPIPPAQYRWDVNLGLLQNSYSETPTYVPSHQSVPDTMREIDLTLAALINGNLYCQKERTLEVYKDHLERDYQNFGTGIKCGDIEGTGWSFSRYDIDIDIGHTWNCFGSARHAFNGTGTGYNEWSPPDDFEVSTYDAPIDWETVMANIQRGDVVEFYHDDDKEHSHTCLGQAGEMYGANNRPGMVIIIIGSEVYVTGKWYWDTCSSQQYYEKFNEDYASVFPAQPPYLNRIKVYRKQTEE